MLLTHWKPALALGFLSWLLPFVFSFLAFPLKRASPPLFDTAMAIALIAVAGLLGRRYFRGVSPRLAEAAVLGLLWVAINLICDHPMFAYGPMRMTAARYYAEIGAGYMLYPAFLSCAVWLAGPKIA